MPSKITKPKSQITKVKKTPKKITKIKLEAKVKIDKPVAKVAKKSGLTVDVYDTKGKVISSMSLPEEIFGKKENAALVAQAVRVYLANQRQGNASTKTRGEVRGSTRKIYRQKGTGRARHGGVRAPIFVHGGLVFGPKPRDYSLKLSQNMKKAALFSSLSSKLKEGNVAVLDGLEKIEPKTKSMVTVLANLKLDDKKRKILVVLPKSSDNVARATRNIEGVAYTLANQLNTYEVLAYKKLVFMKDAIHTLEKTFLGEK